MNAIIKAKPIMNGGYIDIKMKFTDENGNQLSENKLDGLIIETDKVSVTIEEIEKELVNVKSHLYRGGEGMNPYQLYKMAIANLIRNQVSNKWIVR